MEGWRQQQPQQERWLLQQGQQQGQQRQQQRRQWQQQLLQRPEQQQLQRPEQQLEQLRQRLEQLRQQRRPRLQERVMQHQLMQQQVQQQQQLEQQQQQLEQQVLQQLEQQVLQQLALQVLQQGLRQQQQLLHFCDSKHPLVFIPDYRGGATCCGCQESIYGPIYCCLESGYQHFLDTIHHKSCVEVPLGLLHHPLHPIHPLILSHSWISYGEDIQFSKCVLCNESRDQYTYRCSCCDFNLHFTCASLPPTMETEFHDHPLTSIWKWITFTCDICGKEDKGMPYLCNECGFWVHRRCTYFPQRVKVVRHKHLLHLTHSSLQFHQSDSQFCQICVRKVDTRYGLYYCSRCNFATHLVCAIAKENKEDINLREFKDEDEVPELDESVDSASYTLKESKVGKDGTEIATEIRHFSHVHDLKLTNEVLNNKKCYGCVRAILSPFYGCAMCGFFLHESCAKLPKKIRHPLHQHQLTLSLEPLYNLDSITMTWYFKSMRKYVIVDCYACKRSCNGFNYVCENCKFSLDVPCSLIPEILNHHGHVHPLLLSSIESKENCSCCDSNIYPIFRCTTCAFALDFKCAALPPTTSYRQHEHPFTLCYTAEDDSGEYYCDICEEERNSNHWFYYCTDCCYPAHPKCVLGEFPNVNTDSGPRLVYHE